MNAIQQLIDYESDGNYMLADNAAAELAQLQAVVTAAREVLEGQPLGSAAPDDFIANFRIRLGAIRKLASALAALEQETK